LPVLALPGVLDVGEWNQLGVYPELAIGGAGHYLLKRVYEDIAGRDAGRAAAFYLLDVPYCRGAAARWPQD